MEKTPTQKIDEVIKAMVNEDIVDICSIENTMPEKEFMAALEIIKDKDPELTIMYDSAKEWLEIANHPIIQDMVHNCIIDLGCDHCLLNGVGETEEGDKLINRMIEVHESFRSSVYPYYEKYYGLITPYCDDMENEEEDE